MTNTIVLTNWIERIESVLSLDLGVFINAKSCLVLLLQVVMCEGRSWSPPDGPDSIIGISYYPDLCYLKKT